MSEKSNQATEQEKITEFGTVDIKNPKGNIQCLTIIGEIEGHTQAVPNTKTTKYEHVLPMLVSAEQNTEIDGLLVLLNTVGGDVEAGMAIAEMVASMRKPTASVVLGGGHSIGVPLAVSAQRAYIASSATMTLHPVRMGGMVIGCEQTYEYMKKMQSRIMRFVTEHSGISEDTFYKLVFKTGEMANDTGTVLDGKDAVACGLIDQIGGLSDAMDYLYTKIQETRDNHVNGH